MKTKLLNIAVVLILVILTNCKKTEETVQPSLSINPTQKDVEANQGNFIVAVSSTVKWTVSCDKSWLTLDPVSGTGDGTIQVDFELNTSASARTATITFKGSNVADKTLTVTQSSVLPFLSVSPANQNVNAEQGNTAFAIASNTDWIVSSNQIWCTLSQASGKGNASLTASYIANAMPTQRTVTITITSQGLTDQIATVTQAAFVPSLFVSPANQNVGSPAGNTLFVVTANVEWNASSNQDWCTINTGGNGDGVINANFTENTTNQSRTAQITVSGSGVSNQVVTVTQSGSTLTQGLVAYYPFNGNANDESGNGNNGTVWGATLTPDRNGNANGAYSFNGTNNYISFQVNNLLPVGNANRTISLWIKPLKINKGYGSIVEYGTFANTQRFGVLVDSIDHVYFVGQYADLESSVNIIDNNWHNIVVVYESQIIKIYVDNVLNKSATKILNTGNKTLSIGRTINNNIGQNEWFNGSTDDIRIYNRALTAQEIQQLYNE